MRWIVGIPVTLELDDASSMLYRSFIQLISVRKAISYEKEAAESTKRNLEFRCLLLIPACPHRLLARRFGKRDSYRQTRN